MLGLLLVIIPVAVAMAAVNLAGAVKVWMVYPFMLIIGVSMVVDLTSRRALVYDLVGKEHVTNALALEALGMTTGTLLGSLSAGAVISVVGIGYAFSLVAAFYVLAFAVLLGLPVARNPAQAVSVNPAVWEDLRAAFSYLSGQRTLISILGVTVIMNCFYHSFIPMFPLFADRLGVTLSGRASWRALRPSVR